jgi:hypothetical protein
MPQRARTASSVRSTCIASSGDILDRTQHNAMRSTVRLRRISKSANEFRHHQPASLPILVSDGQSCRTLSLQSKHFRPTSWRVIRLQQRCNLDSRRDGAYTSFFGLRLKRAVPRTAYRAAQVAQGAANGWHRTAIWCFSRQIRAFTALFGDVPPSNLQIGEADGDAPV